MTTEHVSESATATDETEADVQVSLTMAHLFSAAILSKRVRELEAQHPGKTLNGFWDEIFANASGAVFASVASLESYANHLLVNHKEPEMRSELMAQLWNLYKKKRVCEKFDFALVLKNAPPAKNGKRLNKEDVKVIIQLRNGLLHFKPEWLSEQKEHATISKRLKNKATRSRFRQRNEPLFPRAWASHETTKWVIESVLTFMVEFERRANIEPRMTKAQNKILDAL